MGTAHTLFMVETDSVNPITRLDQSHKAFNEAWVRDLVFRTPELLPVEDLLADGGVFVPIGIEIPLGTAGRVDVLGITTGGYPIVVETKLWRNPQARREVLAQTIDYIKEVAKFDYAAFEALWNQRKGAAPNQSLFDAASAADPELDEAEFIDRVGRACHRGDIIGFIVGDGIQHGLAELVDHLTRDSSHLRYSIALLELRCFQLPGGGLAVLPNIVREVSPVERAYIKIDIASGLAGQLSVTSVAKTGTDPVPPKRTTLTEEEFWAAFKDATSEETAQQFRMFVENLKQAGSEQKLVETECKQRALMLKVPDPAEAKAGASVFAITSDGKAYNSKHGVGQATRWGLPNAQVVAILDAYYDRLHQICPGFRKGGIVHLNTSQFIPVAEFADRLDDVAREIRGVASALQAAPQEA